MQAKEIVVIRPLVDCLHDDPMNFARQGRERMGLRMQVHAGTSIVSFNKCYFENAGSAGIWRRLCESRATGD